MKYNQFTNLSCYEEFEIQCDLLGISKIDVLKEIGHQIDNYYFFISNDGIFNWYDLEGKYVEDPGVLKNIKEEYIYKNITKCIIPDSVTSIGYWAFAYCESLKEITIPNNITHIGRRAFSCCRSLKEITIPDSVTDIGNEAFSHCVLLTSITIPNSVTRISYHVFYDCKSLISITIPNSITNIDICAFFYCDALKEVIFKGRTLEEVKLMENYPFGIEDKNVIKCEKLKI